MKLPIAIQLYSLRESTSADVEGTLRALKEMGYDGVELAGFYGKSASELRKLCESVGLIPVSAHFGYVDLVENIDSYVDYLYELGCGYAAIASMPREFHKGGEKHEGAYETVKRISAKFKAHGIQLVYHNHNYEMCEYEGKRLYDWLFENMSEEELQPEIDTAWFELEVGEAEQYIRKFKNRCDLVHIKSYYAKEGFDELVHSPETPKRRNSFDFCNYSRGRVDVARMARAAEESGAKWIVVEQDRADDGLSELESAKINVEFLKAL